MLAASCGLQACLDALRPAWRDGACGGERLQRRAPNASGSALRRGVGIACMWYGIGNTVIANPSTMRVGLRGTRRAADCSCTTARWTSARARNGPAADLRRRARAAAGELFDQVMGDTDLTADAGKTSASRQTFVSGNAARVGRARAAPPAARAARLRAPIAKPASSWHRRPPTRRAGAAARSAHSICARCRPRRTATISLARGLLRSADHAARRGRPGRSLRDLRLRRADRRGRGRPRARHGQGARTSTLRTTSAVRSIRPRSKARSTAASPRASAWR